MLVSILLCSSVVRDKLPEIGGVVLSAPTPLLAGFRTYETSLLVEEAISEELPYSGKVHFMMPPTGGPFSPVLRMTLFEGKLHILGALQTKPLC